MSGHRLSDLNKHLFDQLDRLAKPDMTAEEISSEVARTDAVVALSDQIAGLADMQLRAAKLYAEYGATILPYLPQIGSAVE